MHATYAFLFNTTATTADDLAQEAKNVFAEYAERKCDENNWHQEILAVNKEGVVAKLCPKGDYRGRDRQMSYYDDVPADQRFEAARRRAFVYIAHDLEFRHLKSVGIGEESAEEKATSDWLDATPLDEIERTIIAEMSQFFAKEYAELTNIPDEDDLRHWRRKSRVETFELFVSAAKMGVPHLRAMPFTDEMPTPYDGYRAISLSDDTEKANAILFVDIHT